MAVLLRALGELAHGANPSYWRLHAMSASHSTATPVREKAPQLGLTNCVRAW